MSTRGRCSRRPKGHGLTLVEVLVSVIIVVVLSGIVLLTSKTVRDSRMRSTAEQQMAMMAGAIERYAAFWPRWETTSATGKVVVADKGWPDFIPGRLFVPSGLGGPFDAVPGFNEVSGPYDPTKFDVTDIVYSSGRQSFESAAGASLAGHVLNANACLAYALTASTGKGPFIEERPGAGLAELTVVHKQSSPPGYPPYVGGPPLKRQEVFVDPWGTPYRYFWVYRDNSATDRAYKGFLPVTTADTTSADFHKADTFVLESAGPNKKFGNVWRVNPTTSEIDDAWDNLTVMP